MTSSPITRRKGAFSDASWFWVWALTGAVLYELVMLGMGRAGGMLSDIVWHAMGDAYSWRWALVGAPIVGLLLWCVPHFLWQWGEGVHLLAIIGAVFAALAVLVLVKG